MKDFIEQLNLERLSELSIDLQVQLEKGTATRPVLWLLCKAKRRAAEAAAALYRCDPTGTADIIILQSKVELYDMLMQDCQELLTRGAEADRQIDENERFDMVDLLDPDEAQALGLKQTPEDT